jgi:hypothetical protein
MSMLSDVLANLAAGRTGTTNPAQGQTPANYVPQDAITQQYNLANQLRRVAPATSWAGVAAQGLGAVGGNLVHGDANNALASNQAMRKADIANAANANDLPSLEKSLITAQDPDIQSLGLKTKIQQITDDPSKSYRVRAAQAAQYGLQPNTPEFRSFVLSGQLPAPKDPLDAEYKRAQIKALEQKTVDANTPAARALIAQQFGLDPNSDAGKSYILTGKLPREDQQSLTATDKKAILEADDMVGTNKAVLNALDEAGKLNSKANQGWFAGTRAAIGNNLPDMMVPDFISSPESSEATTNLDNAVVGQALTQLKAVFGGNPTEGERKILLDLQGSSSQPANVRAEIFARARRAAETRLKLNEDRANALRGGTFYKPGAGAQAVIDSSPQPSATTPETKTVNGKTYQKIDGQWFEQ